MTHIAASISQSRILAHEAWRRARQAVLEAAARPGELIVLLGPAGVGKTLLLADLERHWTTEGRRVDLVENGELVTGQEPAGILLVDEAGRISDEALQRIAMRGDQLTVLSALPGFAARLQGLDFHPVALTGLEPKDIAAYVAARMAAMGHPPARFSTEAVAIIRAVSGGVPRLLNLLIGSGVFAAGLEGNASVTAAHILEAAEMHDLPVPPDVSAEAVPMDGAATKPLPNHQAFVTDPDVIRELDDLPFVPPPARQPQAGLHAPAAPPAGMVAGDATMPVRRRWPWIGFAALAAISVVGVLGQRPPALPVAAVQEEAPLAARTPSVSNGTTDPLPAAPALTLETASGAARPRAGEYPEMARLPVEPPARVVMVYPVGDAAASARAGRLTAGFRRAGLWAASPFSVPRTDEGDVLRYFFEQDRATALAIATLAGHNSVVPRLAAVPSGAPMPRPGTVEWALPRGGTVQPLRAPPQGAAPAATASLPTATPQWPGADGAIDIPQWPAEITLRWTAPVTVRAFVEVYVLGGSEAGAAEWREIFSGYAAEPLQQPIAVPGAAVYAWRVLSTSPGVPHYVAGPWSRFTAQATP